MLVYKGFFEKRDEEIIGIASTDSPDRDGEKILQDGWDTDNFMKNPVILAGHDYYSFPIGKATELAVQGGKLLFKMVFAGTEKGKEAMQLVKEGVLNAFSVGFMPKEWKDEETISKAELLEISLVSVPANPEAVVIAKGMKDNALAKHFTDEWMAKKEIAEAVAEKLTEEVNVKQDDRIECECGKTYIVKLASQPAEGNQGEEGEGREDQTEADKKALIKAALKSLQKVRELENRKEDSI